MTRLGTYLYGIVRADTEIPAGLPGLEADAPVRALHCGPLTALFSLVPRDDFETEAPADPAWIVPRALRHEHLIEKVGLLGPILPVRFGALFSTRDALEAWLSFNNDVILRFLDHVAGKDEWAVRVDALLDRALEALVEQDPEWALKARLLPVSPGTRYFHEKKLRDQARQQVRQMARNATERVRHAARALAEERILVPRKPDQPDVEPVAHLAYLVPRGVVPALLEQWRQATGNAPCLRLVPSGPWPPAHFCPPLGVPPGSSALEIKWPNPMIEEMDQWQK
jgi:hypothetical protein